MDARLCSMQASTKESEPMRSHSLRVWLGVVTAMKDRIEYYLPEELHKQSGRWISLEQFGKVIPFPTPQRKSSLPEASVQRRS